MNYLLSSSDISNIIIINANCNDVSIAGIGCYDISTI